MLKEEITFADFQKLDLRVGEVLTAQEVVGSTNLIRLQVNFGRKEGERKIIAGIAKWYRPKSLVGKKFIFVVNLAPKKMMNEESQGMILCVDTGSEAKLIPIDKKIEVGAIVR